MKTIADIYDLIDQHAPFESAFSWDNVGLISGDMSDAVNKVLLSLDLTNSAIDKAIAIGADLIITHHPAIFSPVKTLTHSMPILRAYKEGIAVISAHTNFDLADNGVNDCLCKLVGGKVLQNDCPDYRVLEIKKSNAAAVASTIKERLLCDTVRYTKTGRQIERLLVIGGSGGDFIATAKSIGCDGILTGEVKHSHHIEAMQNDIVILEAGHYYTEVWSMKIFEEILGDAVESVFFEDCCPYMSV